MIDNERLVLIQHAQIEMAELYKQLKDGKVGMREAQIKAVVMSKLLYAVRLEIDHYNLISKLPIELPNYRESIKIITGKE